MNNIFSIEKGFSIKSFWVISGIVIATIAVSWMGFFDVISTEYLDETILNSAVAFGVAKGLGSLLAMVKSVEFSVTFVTFNPAAFLHPLMELLDDYANVMKLAMGSLVLQKILLQIVSDSFFKLILTLSGLTMLVSFFVMQGRYVSIAVKTFLFLIIVRFMLVFAVLANASVDRVFLKAQTQEEISVLQESQQALEKKAMQHQIAVQSERNELVEENKTIDEQIVRLKNSALPILDSIEQVAKEIEGLRDGLKEAKTGQEWHQRANLFSSTDKEKALNEKLSLKKEELSVLEDQHEAIVDQLEALAKKRKHNQNIIDGNGNGLFDSMSRGYASIKSKVPDVDFAAMKDDLEGKIGSIINLTVLFLLKTLILPILFGFLFLKLMKSFWQMDIKKNFDNYTGALGSNTMMKKGEPDVESLILNEKKA